MLPASKKLSDQAAAFVEAIVNGKNQTQAAKIAGYAHPAQSGYTLMKSPGIVAKIQQERQKLFHTDLCSVATTTLRSILEDKEASSSSRIAAVRTVYEVCNMIGKHSTKDNDSKALHEMSPDQLAGLINTLESTKSAMAKQIDKIPTKNEPIIDGKVLN
jgi:phage terminase small subunit